MGDHDRVNAAFPNMESVNLLPDQFRIELEVEANGSDSEEEKRAPAEVATEFKGDVVAHEGASLTAEPEVLIKPFKETKEDAKENVDTFPLASRSEGVWDFS